MRKRLGLRVTRLLFVQFYRFGDDVGTDWDEMDRWTCTIYGRALLVFVLGLPGWS